MIRFFLENIKYKLPYKRKIYVWLKGLIENEEKTVGNINLILCKDDYLVSMNKQYLNSDYKTDVISFEFDQEGVISGDIFISIDRVKENASLFHESEHRELLSVICHGVFHLLGYKDKSEKDKAVMKDKENEALNKIVPRET